MRIRLAVAGLYCVGLAFGQGETRYVLTDLGTGFNPSNFAPGTINNAGQILGTINSSGSQAVWSNGTITVLPVPAGAQSTSAVGINDQGQVIGNACCDPVIRQPLLWTNGSLSLLPLLAPDDKFDEALGINNAGQIVGLSVSSSGQVRAVIWQNGVPSLLSNVNVPASASRINDAGQVLVDLYLTGSMLLWQNGTVTNVSGLPGGETSSSASMNNLGQIAGFTYFSASNPRYSTGWLWSNGTTTGLPPPPSYSSSQGGVINDSGQILGQLISSGNVITLAIYDNAHGWRALGPLILNSTAWRNFNSGSINNQGQIVCTATGSDGRVHAILLTPVTPLTVPTTPVIYSTTNVGSSSPAMNVTATNSYTVPIEVVGLGLYGSNASEFKVGTNTCYKTTLAPGATCTVSISFKPRAPAGTRSATLRFFGAVPGMSPLDKGHLGVVALSGASTGTMSIATPTYQLTDLSLAVPAGATARPADAWGMNAGGQVVGDLTFPESQACVNNGNYDSNTQAFLYDTGVVKELGMLPGARSPDPACLPQSQAVAVNNAGQVLGWSNDASGNWRPVLYSGGTVRDLNDLVTDGSGVTFQQGITLNNNGVILAYGTIGRFYLLNQGTATLIPDVSQLNLFGFGAKSVTGMEPRRLNDSGQMVVTLNPGGGAAFLDNDTLINFPWVVSASYLAFNSNGQAAVTLFPTVFNNQDMAVLDRGVVTDLGGFNCAISNSINSSAQVVGSAGCEPPTRDFIWDEINGARWIDSLTPPNWEFGNGAIPQMNDAGQILAQGFNPADGVRKLVLLSPVVSTSTGSNVTLKSGQTTLTFSTVASSGTTTITPIDPATAGTVPGGFAVAGALAYQVNTTATFTGPVTIAFVIPPPISLADFNALSVLHNVNGTLVDVTATSPVRDYSTRTIYATTTSFSPFYLARRSNRVNPLFDQTKAYKSGSTIPVKVQILSPSSANLSSASVPLTIRGVKLIGGSTLTSVQDSGNSNPDSTFRYDATIGGTGGYIYNLSTKGMAPGRYSLSLFAGQDRSFFYTVTFDVR